MNDENDSTTSNPAGAPNVEKSAPEYVRQVQKFTKYLGSLAGAAATILYAATKVTAGLADGCAAVAAAYGAPFVKV